MALILAIEPDRHQAEQIAAIVRGTLGGELVVADAGAAALRALRDRIPDLILTPALLPPKDEAVLNGWLRDLGHAAAHVQTLAVPILGCEQKTTRQAGTIFGRLRDRGESNRAEGCDPAVFAEQMTLYLERAARERAARTAAPQPERASAAPVSPVVDVPIETIAQPESAASAVVDVPIEATAPAEPDWVDMPLEEPSATQVVAAHAVDEATAALEDVIAAEEDFSENVASAPGESPDVTDIEEAVLFADSPHVEEEVTWSADPSADVAAPLPDFDALPAFEPLAEMMSPATFDQADAIAPFADFTMPAALESVPDFDSFADAPLPVFDMPTTAEPLAAAPALPDLDEEAASWDPQLPAVEPEHLQVAAAAPLPENDHWEGLDLDAIPAVPVLEAETPVMDPRLALLPIESSPAVAPVVVPAVIPASQAVQPSVTPSSVGVAVAVNVNGSSNSRVAVDVSVSVNAATVAPAIPRKQLQEGPVQDEWGFFDPEQAGFAAVMARMEQLTTDAAGQTTRRTGTQVRVVSYG